LNALTGSVAIVRLGLAASPEEAVPAIELATKVVNNIDQDIQAARLEGRGGWSQMESQKKCAEFEAKLLSGQ